MPSLAAVDVGITFGKLAHSVKHWVSIVVTARVCVGFVHDRSGPSSDLAWVLAAPRVCVCVTYVDRNFNDMVLRCL